MDINEKIETRADAFASSCSTAILDSYESYGCRVNAISVNDLFYRYEQAGFLYPGKKQLLAPFWPLIRENWTRALRAGELIHYIVSAELDDGAWAAVTSWRSTHSGWNTQHLVGVGGPAASRAVMLASQAVRIRDQFDGSHQNWFQRTNRFANKVFGSIAASLGSSVGWVGDYSYFAVPLSVVPEWPNEVHVRKVSAADVPALCCLADSTRSSIFSLAEGLEDPDLGLEAVDELYRKVGLRRYRRIVVAEVRGKDQLAGVALVYRGPLGFNFSFLENRCDILLAPSLTPANRRKVVNALLATAVEYYADFPPKVIPVIIDQKIGDDVRAQGVKHLRDYSQSIWLRDGFAQWYRHVERIYDRVIKAKRRRGLGGSKPFQINEGQS